MSRFNDMTAKMQALAAAKATVAAWKSVGEKVVFTNGCFDILHRGHVTYLAHAADFRNQTGGSAQYRCFREAFGQRRRPTRLIRKTRVLT